VFFVQPALQRVSDWAVASQHQARRNALVASTMLARVRAERIAAEEAIARAVQRRLPAVRPEAQPTIELGAQAEFETQAEPAVPAPRQHQEQGMPVEA